MKKVLVFGTFDIVHPGHIHMLTEAKNLGDYLIVIVSRDQITTEVKGERPIFSEETRLEDIKKLNIADKVRLGNLGKNRYQVIEEEDPEIIALGYDQVAFVDKLKENIKPHVQIVRLEAFQPETYKSSKIKDQLKKDGKL